MTMTSRTAVDSEVAKARAEEKLKALEIRLQGIDNPDLMAAAEYLYLRNEMKWTAAQVAERWGYKNRSSVYDKIAEWEKKGILEEARKVYLIPKHEEIQVSYDKVMEAWPQVVARQLETAIGARSPKVALEAAAWLHDKIIVPEQAKKQDAGTHEQTYASKPSALNSTNLTRPSFLIPPKPNGSGS